MYLPVLAYIIVLILFGSYSVILSLREEQLKKTLKLQERLYKQRLYETTILKEIQDKIGYSLDMERVIDTLTGSLKNLFTYSTVSSMLLGEDRIIYKIYLEEKVTSAFIQSVKEKMLASLHAVSESRLPVHIEENRTGFVPDDTEPSKLSSFFHVPLVIDEKAVGVITVASKHPSHYKESEMMVLYKMAKEASNAAARLKDVITTEEGKLRAMIGSLSDGIILLDHQSQISLINNVAKKILGIYKDAPTILDLASMMPSTLHLHDKIEQAKSTQRSVEVKEMGIGNHTVQIVITPVFGPVIQSVLNKDTSEKKVIGVAILIQDITLEKSVAAMKETYTYSIVHELRSPLTAIRAASDMLASELHLNDSQKKLLSIVSDQTKRMLGDINVLLDAAKMESGRFSVNQKGYALKDLITDIVAIFTPQAKERDITITTHIQDNLPDVFIDPIRLQQVCNNLISNSLKFTKSGGTIAINATLEWDHNHPKNLLNPGVLVSVSDTGIGIEKEKQDGLFTKFYEIANNFNTSQPGTGLGLFITKGIIEAHGSEIKVQSTLNRGTTVSFILPIAPKQSQSVTNKELASHISHLSN